MTRNCVLSALLAEWELIGLGLQSMWSLSYNVHFQWLKPKKFFKAVDYYKLFYRSNVDVERGRDFSNFILMPEDKKPEMVSLILSKF